MDKEKFSEFDVQRLKEAKDLLAMVWEYYYDYSPCRQQEKRLSTIIRKLETLIFLTEATP